MKSLLHVYLPVAETCRVPGTLRKPGQTADVVQVRYCRDAQAVVVIVVCVFGGFEGKDVAHYTPLPCRPIRLRSAFWSYE